MSSSNYSGKRAFDITLSAILILVTILPLFILMIIIRLTSQGPAIHWSKRIGQNNNTYLMPKLRSMYLNTPQLATNLLNKNADQFITPIGKLVRKTSLDELPQLWSVLVGKMSLVGPRPALFNQYNLIDIRTKSGVNSLKPGITGWAQVNGRDELTDEQKNILDTYYLNNLSLWLDVKILFMTLARVVSRKNVSH